MQSRISHLPDSTIISSSVTNVSVSQELRSVSWLDSSLSPASCMRIACSVSSSSFWSPSFKGLVDGKCLSAFTELLIFFSATFDCLCILASEMLFLGPPKEKRPSFFTFFRSALLCRWIWFRESLNLILSKELSDWIWLFSELLLSVSALWTKLWMLSRLECASVQLFATDPSPESSESSCAHGDRDGDHELSWKIHHHNLPYLSACDFALNGGM